MNPFPEQLDWTSPGLHNPHDHSTAGSSMDSVFAAFDSKGMADLEFAAILQQPPASMVPPCSPLLQDPFMPAVSDSHIPCAGSSYTHLHSFEYASSASSSATNSPGEDSPESPEDMGSTPEQPCDVASETSCEEIKLPPLSPICLLPSLDVPANVFSSSSSSSSSSKVGSGAPLVHVKQEPSSDYELSPTLTSSPPPSVPYPPCPTESDKKQKKKKGRKRKAPPLLSDLDLNLDDDDDDDDTSNMDKKERNKLSAAKYRKRKKLYIGKLEQVNSALQSTVAEQKEKLSAISSENSVLKSQLVFFKKLLAQSNISLSDGRFSPSVAKQASAVLFVLFSVFVITTPFWCSMDSSAVPGFHDPSVSGMKGRVLLSVDEVSCECSGKSADLDHLSSLFSNLHVSATGDVSLSSAADVGFDGVMANLNATQPVFSPASASVSPGVVSTSA